MNFNIEQKIKLGLTVIIVLLIIFFVVLWWRFNVDILSAILVVILTVVILLIVEFYLRVQHNIDERFRRINVDLIKKYLELSYQLESLLKINENSIQGQEQIKQDQEEMKEQIKQSQEETKQDQKQELIDVKKRIQENFWLLNRINWFTLRRERLSSLKQIIPDIFNYKTVLYIGARPDRSDFLDYFHRAGYEITLLEIHPPNVSYFKQVPWINKVILGDVRKFNLTEKFDVIFWWHGPEHIPESDIKLTLEKLEKIAKKVVVLGCPWGKNEYHQPEDNIYEKHLSFFGSNYFEKLGYGVDCLGDKDKSGSHITAVKYVNKKK